MDQCDDVRLKIVDLMNDFLSIKMKRNTFPFLRFISSGNWNERRNYERQTEFPTPETQDVEGWSLTCESVTSPPKTTSTFFLPYSILNSFYLFFLSKQQQKMYCTSQIFCFKIVFPFSFVHALVSLQKFCADSVICLGNRHRQNDKFV